MKKLNRNGFTLIELLAVIVILGILLMTAIPAITKNIAKSRKNTYWQNAKSFAKAAATPYLAGEYYFNGTTDGTVCPLPGPNQYVAIPLTEVEVEQGDTKKSSFNSQYQTTGNCRPMIIVFNKGTVEKDDLQWYFIGKDKANNGIKTLTNINDLKISSVVTGDTECEGAAYDTATSAITIDGVTATRAATCKR